MRFTNARRMHALLGRLKIIRLLLRDTHHYALFRTRHLKYCPACLHKLVFQTRNCARILSTLLSLFGNVVGWKRAKFFPSNCTFCWSTLAHNRMENLQFEVSQLCMVTPSNAQSARPRKLSK
ncbi:hypothetical protein T12_16840 [Trichinella patagoniensis]|uniref:Uncharacterized protein n=1 Tax=Trichinella patagoniensis TaxID=990121 RepID=A0A0V0ZFR7_9BILA|nr:hypothetical protein T12_16840 [Trichinella patagoniensis]